ncbi:MAG: 50S ribosomal protein L11 methyltransferase [Wenzhouxiangella sp.]
MNSNDSGWIQIAVTVPGERAAEAEALLFEAGAASVTLLDAGDHPLHEPQPGHTPIWPEVVVQALMAADFNRTRLIDRLSAAGLLADPSAIAFEPLAARDWERAWMDEYRPMRFGRNLWICPWHLEPEPGWGVVVRLDPGLAFGSGTHPTTALCLEWIDGQELADLDVIDYGCGSGVLAIACALSGAARVIAVDHDRQALRATADNARRNGVEAGIETMLPADFDALEPEARRADIILANILAGPLVSLAPRLKACRRPGARMVLSGILPEQAARVETAYREPGGRIETTIRDGWVRMVVHANGA